MISRLRTKRIVKCLLVFTGSLSVFYSVPSLLLLKPFKMNFLFASSKENLTPNNMTSPRRRKTTFKHMETSSGIDFFQLNPNLQGKAELELNEPKTVEEKLELINLVKQQLNEHISSITTSSSDALQPLYDSILNDDLSILRFLRSKHWEVDETIIAIKKYISFHEKHGAFLQNMTSQEILILKDIVSLFRETITTDDSGRIIITVNAKTFLTKFRNQEFSSFSSKFYLRLSYWFFEELSYNLYAQINGIIIICSFQGLTMMEQLSLSRIASLSDLLTSYQHFQMLGSRLKGAYSYCEPRYVSWVMFFMRPFFNEKVLSRVHMCGHDLGKIHKAILDPTILPKYLGGLIDDNDKVLTEWLVVHSSKL
jgi:hypothetical protein